MKCEDVESVMIDYLDKTLEKEHRDEVEKHLETCERCFDELKDFQQIFRDAESAQAQQPDETLRINFYHMLHAELNKQVMNKKEKNVHLPSFYRPTVIVRIAAAVLLLLAGTFIGAYLNKSINKGNDAGQVAQLRSEVNSMKELMMFDMLKEESPSQRIKAVNYSNEMEAPDENILEALTKTLNRDKNINVRLAAAYSLAKFADRQPVLDSLVASLSMQTEPILQVVLINILVENGERNAIVPIRKIIEDDKTLKEVKDVAQKGIKVLM